MRSSEDRQSPARSLPPSRTPKTDRRHRSTPRCSTHSDAAWDGRCQRLECKERNRVLKRLQDEQDKWKNGGEQAFLRSRLRCVTAESYEAVRRVREELITVHETVKKQMHRSLLAVGVYGQVRAR